MSTVTTLVRSRRLWLHLLLGGFVAMNVLIFARRITHETVTVLRRTESDALTASDEAFQPVLPHLPLHGRIGYLKPKFDRADSTDLAAFFQAQYSLAPRVLVIGTQPDLVIAVARDGSGLPEVPQGFERANVFSGALALYRRQR